MTEHVPPYLPESEAHGWWVGARDPYAPQITVAKGPTNDEIVQALLDKTSIVVELEYRTADMEDDEVDSMGVVPISVLEIYPYRDGVINFLAEGELQFSGGKSLLWVWDYTDGRGAGLDFCAD